MLIGHLIIALQQANAPAPQLDMDITMALQPPSAPAPQLDSDSQRLPYSVCSRVGSFGSGVTSSAEMTASGIPTTADSVDSCA